MIKTYFFKVTSVSFVYLLLCTYSCGEPQMGLITGAVRPSRHSLQVQCVLATQRSGLIRDLLWRQVTVVGCQWAFSGHTEAGRVQLPGKGTWHGRLGRMGGMVTPCFGRWRVLATPDGVQRLGSSWVLRWCLWLGRCWDYPVEIRAKGGVGIMK